MPPLFDHLVDDTSLLAPRRTAPEVDAVVARYLAARDGRYGGLVGQLVCPVSRLSALVAELARSVPGRPVDLAGAPRPVLPDGGPLARAPRTGCTSS